MTPSSAAIPKAMNNLTRPSSSLPSWILGVLFLFATGGAWAWFHVSPKQFQVSYAFHPKSDVPGWTFKPEPVPEQAQEILATTNLFNGVFTNASGHRITVFVGTWDANNPKQMAVVGHTPDVCWVGAGWTPVHRSHPDKMPLDFGTNTIAFEARTFITPDRRSEEFTVWCTLVSGQVYEETSRFTLSDAAADESVHQLKAYGARHTLKAKIVKAVRDRIPGTGSKQFVRFSTQGTSDQSVPFASLSRFGKQWLDLHATHPNANP